MNDNDQLPLLLNNFTPKVGLQVKTIVKKLGHKWYKNQFCLHIQNQQEDAVMLLACTRDIAKSKSQLYPC